MERAAAEVYAALATITTEAFNTDTGYLDEAVLDARDPRYTAALDGLLTVLAEIYGDSFRERAARVADSFNPPPVTAASVRLEPARPPLDDSLVEYAIAQHIASVNNRLRNVPDFVFDSIRSEIETGRRLGESIPKLAARIEALGIDAKRAVTIARTETIAAYNAGNHAATMTMANQFGVDDANVVRMWLATMDSVTRETHADADGQQAIGEMTYTVGADELLYPGDPAGSAGEVINCRCTEEFLLPGDPDYPDDLASSAPVVNPLAVVQGVNPNFQSGGMPYKVNCTNTTGTLELAMRGEQGITAAGVFGREGVTPFEFFQRWVTPHGTPPLGYGFTGDIDALDRYLDKFGGRRAFVIIRLRNGGGHIFNAVKNPRTNDWQFWDGQEGRQLNRSYLNAVADGNWIIQRSDNLRCIDRQGMVEQG